MTKPSNPAADYTNLLAREVAASNAFADNKRRYQSANMPGGFDERGAQLQLAIEEARHEIACFAASLNALAPDLALLRGHIAGVFRDYAETVEAIDAACLAPPAFDGDVTRAQLEAYASAIEAGALAEDGRLRARIRFDAGARAMHQGFAHLMVTRKVNGLPMPSSDYLGLPQSPSLGGGQVLRPSSAKEARAGLATIEGWKPVALAQPHVIGQLKQAALERAESAEREAAQSAIERERYARNQPSRTVGASR